MSQGQKSPDELDKARGVLLLTVFVSLLSLLAVVYVGLHVWRPAGLLSPETTALTIIDKAGTTLDAAQDSTISAEDRATLSELAGQLKLIAPSLAVSQQITATLAAIDTQLALAAPPRSELRTLFTQARNAIQFNQRIYFWSGSSDRWIEMAFWTLFGILVFLLSEIKKYYLKPYDPTGESEKKRNFTQYTPWYVVDLFRGPFIALAILFALSSISLDVVGVNLDVKQAPIEALIFLAGILGFYSRVAEKQLDTIVDKLFHEASVRAGLSRLVIQPDDVALGEGGSVLFRVQPEREVIWFLKGSGEMKGGRYTAPATIPQEEEATVWAIAENDKTSAAWAKVKLEPPEPKPSTVTPPTPAVAVPPASEGNGGKEISQQFNA